MILTENAQLTETNFQIVSLAIFATSLVEAQQARRLAQQYQPQPSNDYQEQDQQQYEPQQKPQQYQAQPQQERKERERTTHIPIIRFEKEQGDDGSYKAA